MEDEENPSGNKPGEQLPGPRENSSINQLAEPDTISMMKLTLTGNEPEIEFQPGTQPETLQVLKPGDKPEPQIEKQPALQNSSQTETMELHHHPHVHHSKKWKDYLFEFLMLFLAVTAGFFVENTREHYVENKRAEQYSKQLLVDLRLDSAFFERRKKDLQSDLEGHVKLLTLLTRQTNASDKEILETLLPITFAYDLPVTTTTYNQMKTSGSLRYIHDPELTICLQTYYDVLLPRCVKLTDASLEYFTKYINPFYLNHIPIQDFDPFEDTLINKQPKIINREANTNQELANIMGHYNSLLKIQTITMNEPALSKIKQAMLLLRHEYNLK
jgi:hypothetical protein